MTAILTRFAFVTPHLVGGCVAAFMAGCGGTEGPADAGEGTDAASVDDTGVALDAAESLDAGPLPGTERWVFQTVTQGPAGRTTYVQLLPAPELVTTVTTARARELAGNARVFVSPAQTVFFGQTEGVRVVRQRVEADVLLDDGEVSFAPTGLGYIPFGNVFVDETHAFLFEGVELRGFGWDPTGLELTEEIDLSSAAMGDLEPQIDPGVVRDGKIFVLVQQFDLIGLDFYAGVQVAVIDAATATLDTILTDTRCVGGRSSLALAEDGTIYVMGDNYNYAARYVVPETPRACLLRIAPGEVTFDADYRLELASMTGGREASGFVYAGGGIAFTTVLYEEQLTQSFTENPLGFFDQQASRWWRVDLTTETATELTALPLQSLGSAVGSVSDGRVFLQTPERGFRGTNAVWEIAADGTPTHRFEVQGLAPVLKRVR